MIFSIVLPVYDEEKAIPSVLEKLFSIREALCRETGSKTVEIIAVSDGSHDRSMTLLRQYRNAGEIRLISFKKNRGYGAALKRGIQRAEGEWVGFLDVDGTCEPEAFLSLWRQAVQCGADICVGSRMGKTSRMPFARYLGNFFFASFISLISGVRVSDAASGMRLLKKAAFEKLLPLPNRMNFTLAMTVKAVLKPAIKIVEIPVPYHQRIGQSKLHAVKDGLRFFKTILDIKSGKFKDE
jgi:glycosyltransferase involved in cell wall biosynthesis